LRASLPGSDDDSSEPAERSTAFDVHADVPQPPIGDQSSIPQRDDITHLHDFSQHAHSTSGWQWYSDAAQAAYLHSPHIDLPSSQQSFRSGLHTTESFTPPLQSDNASHTNVSPPFEWAPENSLLRSEYASVPRSIPSVKRIPSISMTRRKSDAERDTLDYPDYGRPQGVTRQIEYAPSRDGRRHSHVTYRSDVPTRTQYPPVPTWNGGSWQRFLLLLHHLCVYSCPLVLSSETTNGRNLHDCCRLLRCGKLEILVFNQSRGLTITSRIPTKTISFTLAPSLIHKADDTTNLENVLLPIVFVAIVVLLAHILPIFYHTHDASLDTLPELFNVRLTSILG
jgi:hypothetical protein